jgi:hypothetical protein
VRLRGRRQTPLCRRCGRRLSAQDGAHGPVTGADRRDPADPFPLRPHRRAG